MEHRWWIVNFLKKRLNFWRCCNSEDNEHFLSQSNIFFLFQGRKRGYRIDRFSRNDWGTRTHRTPRHGEFFCWWNIVFLSCLCHSRTRVQLMTIATFCLLAIWVLKLLCELSRVWYFIFLRQKPRRVQLCHLLARQYICKELFIIQSRIANVLQRVGYARTTRYPGTRWLERRNRR